MFSGLTGCNFSGNPDSTPCVLSPSGALICANGSSSAWPFTAKKAGGFSGYLSMQVTPPSSTYGYGFSFYSTAWPLLAQPIQGYQVGLPSTWLTPNNQSFTKPLCPSGTLAQSWSAYASNNYRDVFQTIEGGMGTWGGNQFPTANPKYSINGTPNCYNSMIGSPGWDFFTDTTSLTYGQTGIAQLSNRLLIPPDGVTLDLSTNNGLLGISWMALALTSSKTQSSVPVGNQSWTLFLNSTNFSGPVAFWIPDTWSWLSQTDSTIQGRGLDTLPGYLSSFAMEFNTVPFFQQSDSQGNTFVKIPKFQFPMSSDGTTHLTQDVRFYSQAALMTPVSSALAGSGSFPTSFDLTSSATGSCTPNLLSFSDSALNGNSTAVYDFSSIGKTVSLGTCAYGISWSQPTSTYSYFPEYFKLAHGASTYTPVGSSEVPTALTQQAFTQNTGNKASYTSSGVGWSSPGPASSEIQVNLSDGSQVTYVWYRFIDQPAMQGLGWSDTQLNSLQAEIVSLHAAWNTNLAFQASPSTGSLVSLDSGLLVTPPAGLETGYVPIVVRQTSQ